MSAKTSPPISTVAVPMPALSRRRGRRAMVGIERRLQTMAGIPMTTLTANTARQPASATSIPPSSGPAAIPMPPAAVHQPTSRCRIRSSVADVVPKTSALGSRRAAPAPWTSRALSNISIEVAVAQTAEAAVKTSRPATNVRFAPSVSVIAPAPSITAAKESV